MNPPALIIASSYGHERTLSQAGGRGANEICRGVLNQMEQRGEVEWRQTETTLSDGDSLAS